jgi:hypothetical protein
MIPALFTFFAFFEFAACAVCAIRGLSLPPGLNDFALPLPIPPQKKVFPE